MTAESITINCAGCPKFKSTRFLLEHNQPAQPFGERIAYLTRLRRD
ncbi:MAG: hypothetical protein LBT09_04550 [Planctomycetaceae bacterium]|nr:hypothetical protein [Planctomycetaceae bacterium]